MKPKKPTWDWTTYAETMEGLGRYDQAWMYLQEFLDGEIPDLISEPTSEEHRAGRAASAHHAFWVAYGVARCARHARATGCIDRAIRHEKHIDDLILLYPEVEAEGRAVRAAEILAINQVGEPCGSK